LARSRHQEVERHTPPGTPRWGSAWKKATADWYSHAFTVGAQGSCYPHRENFLDLDPDYSDVYGQPLLRMTFDFRAMKSAAITWDEASLDRYLTNSQALVPGNIMPFSGIQDAAERAAVIAYLRTLR